MRGKKDPKLKRPSLETWHTDTHILPERLQFARGCSETRNQSLWHGPFHQQPPLSRPTEPNPWSTPRAHSNTKQPSEPALGTSPRDTARGIWHLRLHRLWHTTDESNHGDGRRVTMVLGGQRHINSSLELNKGLGLGRAGGSWMEGMTPTFTCLKTTWQNRMSESMSWIFGLSRVVSWCEVNTFSTS